MKLRTALLALALLLFLSACNQGAPAPVPTRPEAPAAGPGTGPGTGATPAPPDPGPGVAVASLFSRQDLAVTFRTWDLGPDKQSTDTQHLLPGPGSLTVVHNGRPYFTWRLDDTGLWREDPKNPGTLLRYLPSELHDGQAWSQPSGDATVWFHVARHESMCSVVSGQVAEGCWRLTMVNRGEQLVYELAPGIGPVQVRSTNGRNPGASFLMAIEANAAPNLSPGQRADWMAGAATRELPRSPVTEVTAAQFLQARDRELGFRTVAADLDGDGRAETIRGLRDDWSLADVDVFDAGGAHVARLHPFLWAHRVTPVRLQQPAMTVLLEWHLSPGGDTAVGIRALGRPDDPYPWRQLYGWGLKHAETTAATRATMGEDGILTVEWEMGDPAGHVRVRQYELHLEENRVQIVSETLRPQGEALRYPGDPEGVLQAAYVAATHHLEAELPLYFASDAASKSFQAMVGTVPYELGSIRLVRAAAPDQYCNIRTESVQPGSDGAAPFLIGVGGSPTVDAKWGTVTFATDEQGRPVIAGAEVTGRCPN